MASASAAERSQADDELRHRRGEQVVMVFSGQVRCIPNASAFLLVSCIRDELGNRRAVWLGEWCLAGCIYAYTATCM
jgi:hypothetical protein